MTDKIIIDGVDVSGCEFYQIEANELYPKAQYCGSMRNTFCENEPNCYYKQRQRLEQENAELKAENERLKEECDMYKTFYRAKHDDIKGILFKYRQTLREIKTIAEDRTKTEDYLLGQEYTDLVDKIIDIITKAESEG